jgi:hypothetical protein
MTTHALLALEELEAALDGERGGLDRSAIGLDPASLIDRDRQKIGFEGPTVRLLHPPPAHRDAKLVI